MKNESTSPRVAKIASRLWKRAGQMIKAGGTYITCRAEDVRAVAASSMTQAPDHIDLDSPVPYRLTAKGRRAAAQAPGGSRKRK